MVMALASEASAPSAHAVLAGRSGRSGATIAREVYKYEPGLFGVNNIKGGVGSSSAVASGHSIKIRPEDQRKEKVDLRPKKGKGEVL